MDYDGANQHAVTHLNSISLSPRVSPDGSRIAFSSLTKGGWEILMYSLDLNRLVTFPRFGGTNLSPAWSSDGTKLAFSSSRSGDAEIYVVDSSGANLKRITSFKGPDVSPAWNRKTGTQIAWVSGRTGLPQVYTMESDGTNVQRLDRSGLCGLARMVSQRAISGGVLDAQVWARGAGSAGYLHHGHRQQAVGATDSRWRAQRLSLLVAGWQTHYFPVQPCRQPADLDHAGRWYKSEAVNLRGQLTPNPTGVGSDYRNHKRCFVVNSRTRWVSTPPSSDLSPAHEESMREEYGGRE